MNEVSKPLHQGMEPPHSRSGSIEHPTSLPLSNISGWLPSPTPYFCAQLSFKIWINVSILLLVIYKNFSFVAPATPTSPSQNGDSHLVKSQASKIETIKNWSISTYKCTKQLMFEKLGKTSRTVDAGKMNTS